MKDLSKKNTAIELLRILAMMMILYMHTLDIAAYNWTISKPFHLNFMSFPEVFLMLSSVIAVNVFAMISGYLMGSAKFKISRLFSIYLQTVFYTIGFTILFSLFKPEVVSIKTWASAILAIYSYWYVRSYFAVLLFLPILGLAINYFRNRILFFCILLCFISVVSTIIPGDMCCVQKGYSFVWLSIMFVIGGLIRNLENQKILQQITRSHLLLLFLSCVSINIIGFYSIKSVIADPLQKRVLFTLVAYCNPIVVIQSISFFLFGLKTEIKNVTLKKIYLWMGPLVFAVYLIHMNPLFRFNLFNDGFSRFFPFWQTALSEKQYPIIWGIEIVSVVTIFIACCIIDWGRIKLFQLCHIPKLLHAIDQMPLVKNIFDRHEDKTKKD